jgi:hypothetical protein
MRPIIILLAFLFENLVYLHSAEANAVTTFKDFLLSRPSVSNITFTRTITANLPIPARAKKPQTYEARWDSAGFVAIDHHDKKFGGDTLAGRFENRFYTINQGQLTWGAILPDDPSYTNSTEFKLTGVLSQILNIALDLGIHDLERGTLKWQGNDFSAQTHDGKKINGSLFVRNELPDHLSFSIVGDPRTYDVHYEYGSYPSDRVLPEEIVRMRRYNGNSAPESIIRISRLTCSEGSLPSSLLNPTLLIETNQGNVFTFQNGQLYYPDPLNSNRVAIVLTKSEAQILEGRNHSRMTAIIAASTLVLGIMFIFVWHGRRWLPSS